MSLASPAFTTSQWPVPQHTVKKLWSKLIQTANVPRRASACSLSSFTDHRSSELIIDHMCAFNIICTSIPVPDRGVSRDTLGHEQGGSEEDTHLLKATQALVCVSHKSTSAKPVEVEPDDQQHTFTGHVCTSSG
jgi:hypothetical protein